MCGIALLLGPRAQDHRRMFDAMMDAIEDRGESQEIAVEPEALVGTARLKIVDRDRAVQKSDGPRY